MNDYWQLKRNDNDDIIQFPQDMRWMDELDWTPLAQSKPVRAVSGGQIIQQSLKKAGRPITLGGDWVWLERKDNEKLQAWLAVPRLTMTLTHYDEREFTVIFRTHEKGIVCEPVIYTTPELAEDPYITEIRLMTIQG